MQAFERSKTVNHTQGLPNATLPTEPLGPWAEEHARGFGRFQLSLTLLASNNQQVQELQLPQTLLASNTQELGRNCTNYPTLSPIIHYSPSKGGSLTLYGHHTHCELVHDVTASYWHIEPIPVKVEKPAGLPNSCSCDPKNLTVGFLCNMHGYQSNASTSRAKNR